MLFFSFSGSFFISMTHSFTLTYVNGDWLHKIGIKEFSNRRCGNVVRFTEIQVTNDVRRSDVAVSKINNSKNANQ